MSEEATKPWSKELSQALSWWSTKLTSAKDTKAAKEAVAAFERQLSSLLEERFAGHWFEENPIRGQAHRSLSLHRQARPDPVLAKAAQAANIRNLFDFFSEEVTDVTMFIDPCEVAVQTLYTFCKNSPQETIVWTSPLKLNKRKPNMEPSAPLYIKAKPLDVSSTSSGSSSPSGSPRSSPERRSSNEDGRMSPASLKASAKAYAPSPSHSPERAPSPIAFTAFHPGSLPYYVPVPQFYQPYPSNPRIVGGFDPKLAELVRS